MAPLKRETIWGQKAKSFVRVFFKKDQLTMIVRRDELKEASRPVISQAEAKRVLKHLDSSKAKMDKQWKSRTRKNERALEKCDPYELADVYKGLVRMEDQGEKLRAADRKAMQSSFDILTAELSAALGKPQQAVEAMVQS